MPSAGFLSSISFLLYLTGLGVLLLEVLDQVLILIPNKVQSSKVESLRAPRNIGGISVASKLNLSEFPFTFLENMNWVFFEIKQKVSSSSPLHPQYRPAPLQPPTSTLQPFNLDSKISPSILIILILAIIFFVSGLLHLLVRLLLRAPGRDPDELEDVTALQGQLQQLFHLHDAGVDQSLIDTLPVFLYNSIIGLKDPFDCAVCLCEFEIEDKLRLLPRCSHAFHMGCIDTWLLSHSTCPLCRAGLLVDVPLNCGCSPIVSVLESGSESFRVIGEAAVLGRTSSVFGSSSHLGIQREADLGSTRIEFPNKSFEVCEKNETVVAVEMGNVEEKIVQVKLGKLKNVDVGVGSSENNVHSRRCYSMGSFAYVLDESSSLQLPIRIPTKKQNAKKCSLPLYPGYRTAFSEYESDSRRDFNGIEAFRSIEIHETSGSNNGKPNTIQKIRKESFSMSKIWLRGDKEKSYPDTDSTKRAFSLWFPVGKCVIDTCVCRGVDDGSGIASEGSEMGFDEETQSCCSLDPQVV